MKDFEARGASLAAIAVDPPERSRALAGKLGLPYPLLSDVDLTVTRAFGLEDVENGISWPALYVVTPDGTVRWRSLSETYKERAAPDLILQALPPPRSPAGH
jgi:peroxiredoxin